MEYKAVSHASLAQESCSFPFVRCSFDLEELLSFRQWRENLRNACHTKLSCFPNLSIRVSAYIRLLFRAQYRLLLLSGQSSVLVYHWHTGEPKIVNIWNERILLIDNLYWLNSYPFLASTSNRDTFCLTPGCKPQELLSDNSVSYSSVTHNNHFGHFAVDDLPLLFFTNSPSSLPLGTQRSLVSTYPLSPVIKELCMHFHAIDVSSPPFLERGHFGAGSLGLLRCQHNRQTVSSSILCNAFLIRKFCARSCGPMKSEDFHNYSESNYGKLIFLVRSGEYATRISNIDELAARLSSLGFIQIDPAHISIRQLAYVLGNADVVVSEGGSTTINAIIFCPLSVRIVSLVPGQLISHTSESMLYGGLPYIIPFLDRVDIFCGYTTHACSIQSSNICCYDTESLVRYLDL